jgi:uncharacterized membrane protein
MNEDLQTTEIRETNIRDGDTSIRRQTVRQDIQADGRVVASRVVWYIAGFVIVLLLIRVLLLVFGANRANGFVDFIYSVSGVFSAPFTGIFATPSYNGQFYLDSASLVAAVVYMLVAWGITKLFLLTASKPA